MSVGNKLFYSIIMLSSLGAPGLEALTPEQAELQARQLYMRLTSVPPSPELLRLMKESVMKGRTDLAAFKAMENILFYSVTIRNMVSAWTNREQSPFVPLNDATALMVGLVYENYAFNEALYGDVLYSAHPAADYRGPVDLPNARTIPPLLTQVGQQLTYQWLATDTRITFGSPPDGTTREDHFTSLDRATQEWPRLLHRGKQSDVYRQATGTTGGSALASTQTNIDSSNIAGILTTSTFARAGYQAGTNRRGIDMLMKNFLGRDMRAMHDTSLPDTWVGPDVDPAPGGDFRVYQNECRGCHAIMDGFRGAFAYFDFNQGGLTYNPENIPTRNEVSCADDPGPGVHKFFRGCNLAPYRRRTEDDSWTNMARTGVNRSLGWRDGPSSGRGARSFGLAIARAQAFSQTMAKHVFKQVCVRDPNEAETNSLSKVASSFETGFENYDTLSASGPYNMRALFAIVSTMCFGR